MTQAQAEFRDAKACGLHTRRALGWAFAKGDRAAQIAAEYQFSANRDKPGFMEGFNDDG